MLIQAVDVVHTVRQTEDTAYKRFSGKDFASDNLMAADQLEDKYMYTIHNILNAQPAYIYNKGCATRATGATLCCNILTISNILAAATINHVLLWCY